MSLADPNTITWIWFIVGILLLGSEFLISGFVIIFFGGGAIAVAVARWLGLIESWASSTAVWLISSLLLVVALRKTIRKFLPAETSYQAVEEDIDAYGTVVEVIKTVYDDNDEGRIRYQGTSWPSICEEGTIPAGKKAKLLARNNLAWIVEPYTEIDELDIEKT